MVSKDERTRRYKHQPRVLSASNEEVDMGARNFLTVPKTAGDGDITLAGADI